MHAGAGCVLTVCTGRAYSTKFLRTGAGPDVFKVTALALASLEPNLFRECRGGVSTGVAVQRRWGLTDDAFYS